MLGIGFHPLDYCRPQTADVSRHKRMKKYKKDSEQEKKNERESDQSAGGKNFLT